MPNYASNYYATTGSYDFSANGYTVTGTFQSLNQAYMTYYPDPDFVSVQTVTIPIPLSPAPSASKSQQMAGGPVGVAKNGVILYDSVAGGTDSIFAESGSFDQCGGHPNDMMTYHYHSEPYALSYDDSAFIGVMRDGYFVYGRRDADGSTPGTIAAQVAGGTGDTNLIYIYGGHTGTAPSSSDTNGFHYHLTEWKGCFDETVPSMTNHNPTKNSDDATTYDTAGTFDTPAASTCNGTWVDAWFLTGHGNGGVFQALNASLTSQSPSQTQAAIRYYYGTPATCTACMGK
jgi:hypothetical protein